MFEVASWLFAEATTMLHVSKPAFLLYFSHKVASCDRGKMALDRMVEVVIDFVVCIGKVRFIPVLPVCEKIVSHGTI